MLSFIAMKALRNTVGVFGQNRAFLSAKYQNGHQICDLLVPTRLAIGSEDEPNVEQIRELICAKDGSNIIENFHVDDINLVLDDMSTYWRLCYIWIKLRYYLRGYAVGVGVLACMD